MKDDEGGAIAMAMLPPPPTKPTTLPWLLGFKGGGKKKSTLIHIPHTKGKRVSCGKIELTIVAVAQGLFSGLPLVL